MADHRPTPDAVAAALALPLALRELEHAVNQSEFVANRAGAATLTLTIACSGSLPVHFQLGEEEREAAVALLPRFSAARIEAAQAKVQALTERVARPNRPAGA